MSKSKIRRHSPVYLTPSPSPERDLSPPRPASVLPDWDVDAMSNSRPPSTAGHTSSSMQLPTLADILSNTSSPPWTLTAFMQYLSQNHCLETLEFTMDADRYQTAYQQILSDRSTWMRDRKEHVCSLWEKLLQAYIVPYAPREVNLPSPVRDRLLSLSCSPNPPLPTELNEAVRIVFELMNDSVLLPFIESVSPPLYHEDAREDDLRPSRSHARSSKDVSQQFLPSVSAARASSSRSVASAEGADREREGLTDDSGSAASPPSGEPMTPPTTPPTSEWTFSTSPGGFQRAISAHNNGWKKMGAKFGFNRKTRSQRLPSNSSVDGDTSMSDASFSNSL